MQLSQNQRADVHGVHSVGTAENPANGTGSHLHTEVETMASRIRNPDVIQSELLASASSGSWRIENNCSPCPPGQSVYRHKGAENSRRPARLSVEGQYRRAAAQSIFTPPGSGPRAGGSRLILAIADRAIQRTRTCCCICSSTGKAAAAAGPMAPSAPATLLNT